MVSLAIMLTKQEYDAAQAGDAKLYVVGRQSLSTAHNVILRDLLTGTVLFPHASLKKEDVVLEHISFLRQITAEYFADELTNRCNMACPDCFNANDRTGSASYMSIEIARAIAKAMDSSARAAGRQVCLTGGEPTLDLESLISISKIFAGFDGNRIVIASNGTSFPLDKEALKDFFDRFSGVSWQLSYDEQHSRNFPAKKKQRVQAANLPYAKRDPLLAVIVYVANVLNEKGKKLGIRVTVPPDKREQKEKYLQRLMTTLDLSEHDLIYGNGKAHPYTSLMAFNGKGRMLVPPYDPAASAIGKVCGTGEEVYVDCKGKIWPTYLSKIQRINYAGRIVRVEKQR